MLAYFILFKHTHHVAVRHLYIANFCHRERLRCPHSVLRLHTNNAILVHDCTPHRSLGLYLNNAKGHDILRFVCFFTKQNTFGFNADPTLQGFNSYTAI